MKLAPDSWSHFHHSPLLQLQCGVELCVQLQESGPLTGIQEGSAGDLFVNLHVKKEKPEQLINGLPAFPGERDDTAELCPLYCTILWVFSTVDWEVPHLQFHTAIPFGVPLLSSIGVHTK